MNRDITVQELHQKIEEKQDFILIDVRETYEYEDYNIGGILIPLGNIPTQLDELKKYQDQEIIIHCKSGARSASAQSFLIENGFQNVRNLIGGVMAWEAYYPSHKGMTSNQIQ